MARCFPYTPRARDPAAEAMAELAADEVRLLARPVEQVDSISLFVLLCPIVC